MMDFKTFTDGKGRAVLVDPSSKDITLKKIGFNTYTTFSSEDLDFIIELINTMIKSSEAKHYLYSDGENYESAEVILGSLRISIDSNSIYIDETTHVEGTTRSSLAGTLIIFDKFLINFNYG